MADEEGMRIIKALRAECKRLDACRAEEMLHLGKQIDELRAENEALRTKYEHVLQLDGEQDQIYARLSAQNEELKATIDRQHSICLELTQCAAELRTKYEELSDELRVRGERD